MTSQQEKVVIVKCLYADKNTITQAKANPKLLNEVENLTKTNQDYYEIPPDEGYIKPYFDWDKKLDYEPNEAQIMEVGRNVSKDFEALGFTQGTWATRHGLSASGRHKISFRAWVSDYKTTKADLNRRVKAYKKANPDSDIDDGVYSSERKMGLVNCIKGSTQVYPKDPAYTGSGKKPIYLPDTRILKRMFNNTKPFSATIIGIVNEDAKVWEFDEDEYQSVQAQPTDTDSTFSVDEEYDPKDAIELFEQNYTNPLFYKKYNFSCDEKGTKPCPNCGVIHSGNNYVTWRDDQGFIWTKNLSRVKGCEKKCLNTLPSLAFQGLPDTVQDEGKEDEYDKLKQELENDRDLAMIEKGLMYLVDGDTFLNKKELTETFQDVLLSAKVGRKVREVPFTDLWFRDPKKRKYKSMEFAPDGCPPDVYNLWKGYRVANLPENTEEVDIEPFKVLLRAITNSKEGEDAYDYMLFWLAFLFKYPHLKTLVAVVIRSLEGIGKNTLFWFVGEVLMGNELYNETNSPDTDIFGTFTTFFERKKLVVLDEANCFKYHEKLCPLITNLKTTIRRKYLHPFDINNYSQIAILTNNDLPVKISPSDRRYVVLDGNASLKGNKEFFDNFYKVLAPDSKFQRAVYDYLMGQDVENFDFVKQRPDTDGHKEIQRRSMTREQKFIIHYITDAWGHQYGGDKPLESGNFFKLFEEFCGQSNLSEKPNPGGFGARLRNLLKKNGVYSEKNEARNAFHKTTNEYGYMVWNIDRKKAFEWIKSKGFTDYENYESLPIGITYWSSPRRGTPEYKEGAFDDTVNRTAQFFANRIRETH